MTDRNIFDPDWDAEQDEPPFTWRRARLGRQAGCEKLGASLFELPPGASSFPLHVHYANEELLVVVSGQPTLRTLDGERELLPGEFVSFPPGRRGAHRLDNRADEPAHVMIVSTMISPEVNEYPDSGKIWTRSFAPGADGGPDDLDVLARPDPQLGYLDGER
ncbi:MAG: hypothetical protein QOK25_1901 [Thermoleophilaceae bacterium]|jgi:uncharacterized cupin superfamily protein|nr:hypothetical protein [Thermoleophilaceae bacterium]